MNTKGITVYDAMIVVCSETDKMYGIERYGDPSPAHAEIGADGNVMFITHPLDDESEGKILH